MADSQTTLTASAIPQSTCRRSIIAAGAAAIGATAVAAPVAMAGTPAGAIDALWTEFASLGPKVAAAEARITAATEAMPAWAAPGPKYLRSDGSYYGDIVDAPPGSDGHAAGW